VPVRTHVEVLHDGQKSLVLLSNQVLRRDHDVIKGDEGCAGHSNTTAYTASIHNKNEATCPVAHPQSTQPQGVFTAATPGRGRHEPVTVVKLAAQTARREEGGEKMRKLRRNFSRHNGRDCRQHSKPITPTTCPYLRLHLAHMHPLQVAVNAEEGNARGTAALPTRPHHRHEVVRHQPTCETADNTSTDPVPAYTS
jgi:hypothetical protein